MAPHPFATEFIRRRSNEELLWEAALARRAFEATLGVHRVSPPERMKDAARRLLDLFAGKSATARRAGRPASL